MPKKKKPVEDWITISEAMKITSKTKMTILNWKNTDKYPSMREKKIKGRIFISKSEVLSFNKTFGKVGPPTVKEKEARAKARAKDKIAQKKTTKDNTHELPPELQCYTILELYNDDLFKGKPLLLLKLREEFLRIRATRLKIENENKESRKGYVTLKEALKIQARVLHEINLIPQAFKSAVAPSIEEVLKLPRIADRKKAIKNLMSDFIFGWCNGWRGNMARQAREMKIQIEEQGCIVDVNNNFEVIEIE